MKRLISHFLCFIVISGCVKTIENHLVIDAGSSGTRFCIYSINHDKKSGVNLCSAPMDPSEKNNCIEIPAEDGLADLTEQKALDVLRKGFSSIDPGKRKNIRSGILLATGGFRKLPEEIQKERLSYLLENSRQFLEKVNMKVITGEEEGRLAWKTISALGINPGSGYSVIETGGATVQFTTGSDFSKLKSGSFPVGMNVSRNRLQKIPAFKNCYNKNDIDATASFDRCRSSVSDTIFQKSGIDGFLKTFSEDEKKYPLFALGAAWGAISRLTGKKILTGQELAVLGNEFCSLSNEKITQKGIPKKHAPNTCYLLSYQYSFLERTKKDTVHLTEESWPRGAATSENNFPDCNINSD